MVLGKVERIDIEHKEVVSDRLRVPYDYLVLATGSHHSYFGKDDWAIHAPGLKRITDATEIRKRILLAFELAEVAMTEAERQRQLTFVVIGGGPTGVEMAGAIAELARYTLASDFRNINPRSARIILAEGGNRLLKAFPGKLSAYAKRALEKLGVEVVLNTMVQVCGEEGAAIGSALVPTATMIWAAGVTIPHLKNWLPRRNRQDRPRASRARSFLAGLSKYFCNWGCRFVTLAKRASRSRYRSIFRILRVKWSLRASSARGRMTKGPYAARRSQARML